VLHRRAGVRDRAGPPRDRRAGDVELTVMGAKTMTATGIPRTQYAVQLVGPDELRLNPAKEVHPPGARQILARTEAVGLCFSDLKLLKQFSQHVRKGEITGGIARD